jgi:hypothetical protein
LNQKTAQNHPGKHDSNQKRGKRDDSFKGFSDQNVESVVTALAINIFRGAGRGFAAG